jgi:hypothetical protein
VSIINRLTRPPRRIGVVLAVAVTAALMLGGAVALAAHPKPSGTYSGSGEEFMNNTPHGAYVDRHKRANVTFHVTVNGGNVVQFVGHYDRYCGGGPATVDDSSMAVAGDGSFHDNGAYANRITGGTINGVTHATITGRFVGNGRVADVTYQAVTDLYASRPGTRGCGTEVRASMKAR